MTTTRCAASTTPVVSGLPVSIAGRVRDLMVTAPHPHASVLVWLAWLDAKAELFEAIASCAADEHLAADATRMARSVRAQMKTAARGGAYPYLSGSALLNVNVEVAK